MWKVQGVTIDAARFGALQPARTLYEFDGPRIFTFLDAERELFLACWSDEDDVATRYVVVPFTGKLVTRLERGELSVRDALDQPRCWLVDMGHVGIATHAYRVDLDDVPDDALPVPGALLLSSLERRLRTASATEC